MRVWKQEKSLFFDNLVFMSSWNFMFLLIWAWKSYITMSPGKTLTSLLSYRDSLEFKQKNELSNLNLLYFGGIYIVCFWHE